MTNNQKLLCAFYALVSLAALIATWSQNAAYFNAQGDIAGAFLRFAQETRVNPASRSITVDIGMFLLAAAAFMAIEARRLGVKFVWAYVVGGFLIAISVTFPLFMIAREARIAKLAGAEGAWALTGFDVAGIAAVAAAIFLLSAFVLN